MSNIVQLSSVTSEKYIYGDMMIYFKRLSQESENTAKTYAKAVEHFFMTVRNKKLTEVSEADLNFSLREIEQYQMQLRKTMKASTVNTKMSAIKKTMNKMQGYGFDINTKLFELDRYNEHDSVSYDPMTTSEVLKAIEVVSKTRKGLEKSLFIKIAFSTAFRKESIQSLKWSDFSYENDYWTVKTLGKGNKWDKKKISDSLYNEIIEFKKTIEDRDRVFTLSNSTIDTMMNLIRKEIDFGDKRIVFHSLKKSSIEEVGRMTNYDLKAMQAQGNHSNVSTTLNSYLSSRKIEDMITVDLDSEINLDPLKELTADALFLLIKNSDKSTQIKLLKKMEEIKNED